VHPEV